MAKEGNQNEKTTLCITRKSGEVVWIGQTRVEIIGATVKVRITAPRKVVVLREEVLPCY